MPTPEPAGRASPPTDRVVAVLNFLAAHPHDRFGLSELARRVQLSKPTCLGIITALTAAGYLSRDPDQRDYRLGPALITLGQRARDALTLSPAAGAQLRRLATRFNTTAALAGIVDDRITVLDLAAPPGAAPGAEVGQSYPFAPPVGLMFVLWDDAALHDWLAREPTIPLRTDGPRLDRVIEACRATGYLVERLTPGGRRLYGLLAGVPADLPDELKALLSELVADVGERVYLRGEAGGAGRTDVSVIAAPVYDPDRRQAMVLSLQVGRALTDTEITGWAAELTAAAAAITAGIGGQAPDAADPGPPTRRSQPPGTRRRAVPAGG